MSVEFVQRRGRRQRDVQEDGASVESPRSASPPEEEEDAVIIKRPTAAMSKGKSLKDRSKIPPSFAVTFGTILGLQCFSGMWQLSTLESWISSLQYSFIELATLTMNAIQVVFGQAPAGSLFQYAQTIILTTFCGFLAYVFFVAPALAGLWTGRKARRAVFHRYMGLSYLIHYMLACVELLTNYTAAKNSYLGHIVAVTGTKASARPVALTRLYRHSARHLCLLHLQSTSRTSRSGLLFGQGSPVAKLCT